ncbi:TetR/AcrR family transcriptional regulator [Microbacterium azadirachtae]|uniref:Bacterial regulatory protein, tetR family n=1 Tax=Microbacterium azadirachtae TaxID=582680 RepID=A0A0F0LWT5_9MICO|nr:TetR/AcrR family transcriptional regulator [Microbacterium azadirachtae]KJL35851.1 Bacterial regulatory protein, tetR family [Microbacterium azadirachtae]
MPESPRTRTSARIQDAAWEIFSERGLPGVTMEAIAIRAGVAKTTVYRRWPTKSAILIDALKERLAPLVKFPQEGTVRDDVVAQIEAVIDLFGSRTGRAYLALIAESVHDPDVGTALRERYIADQREAAILRLRIGIDHGELASRTDPEILIDSLYGALYYRVLVAHVPLDRAYATRLVDSIWPVA